MQSSLGDSANLAAVRHVLTILYGESIVSAAIAATFAATTVLISCLQHQTQRSSSAGLPKT